MYGHQQDDHTEVVVSVSVQLSIKRRLKWKAEMEGRYGHVCVHPFLVVHLGINKDAVPEHVAGECQA